MMPSQWIPVDSILMDTSGWHLRRQRCNRFSRREHFDRRWTSPAHRLSDHLSTVSSIQRSLRSKRLFDRSASSIGHPLHFNSLSSWLAALCRTHPLSPLPRPITNKSRALCNDVKEIGGQSFSVIKGCSLTHPSGKRINLGDNFRQLLQGPVGLHSPLMESIDSKTLDFG